MGLSGSRFILPLRYSLALLGMLNFAIPLCGSKIGKNFPRELPGGIKRSNFIKNSVL